MSGKIGEKSGNFEVDDKWQPWLLKIAKNIKINFFSATIRYNWL